MKTIFVILSLVLLATQCKPLPEEPDYDQLIIERVNALQPQLTGTWQLITAQINAKKLVRVSYPTGITKDTTLQDVAQVKLQPATIKESPDKRILELEGTLLFRSKTYPIKLNLSPLETELISGYAWFSFDHRKEFIDTTTEDVDYLEGIGLVYENFEFRIVSGSSTMNWQGKSRAIVSASFRKN